MIQKILRQNIPYVTFMLLLQTTVQGCYQIDRHHQLPCEIPISQKNATGVPKTPSPSTQVITAPSNRPSPIAESPSSSTSAPVSTFPPSREPSTMNPSKWPTLIPTFIPTNVPVMHPPTPFPTTLPSKKPTSVPTIPSTATPTSAPTTLSPTVKATPAPSLVPTRVPSAKPTKGNCQAQPGGFFGGITTNANLVSFGYELQTKPISEQTLQREVLPSLETSFVNSLLPNLFGNICSGRRLQLGRRRLLVVGISARPDDVPLSGVQCQQQPINSQNNCSVVSGALTIFTSGKNSTDDEELIQSVLQAGMTNGSYLYANPNIVELIFVNLGDYSSSENGNSGNNNGSKSGNGSANNKYLFSLIPAVAAALLVIGAVLWRRRNQSAGDADDSTTNQSGSRAVPPQENSGAPVDDELPGLPAPMSLEEGTVYTHESNN